MKSAKRLATFVLVGLLCGCLLSGCHREKPLDAALERWQLAIVKNDMEPVWIDLFSLSSDSSIGASSAVRQEFEWYETESTAFDGTMLEPYVERARNSIKLEVTDRRTINIEGVRLDVAMVEIRGDGLSMAICDWLQAARAQLPAELLANWMDFADSRIIADTMNGNDTPYGQAGTEAFKEFDSYYEAYEGKCTAQVELSATWVDDYIVYSCSGDSSVLKDAACGVMHLGGPVDEEYANYMDYGYAINRDDLMICYSDIMQQNYWQVFRFPNEE